MALRIGRRGLLAAGALAATPAWAQEAAPPTTVPAPAPEVGPAPAPNPRVAMQTGQGLIVLELEATKAPITVANFLHYVDKGRYAGSSIYRATRTKGAPQFGLIEGGLQNNRAKIFPPIAHESTTQTGLKHTDGTISMARTTPGSANADFFICIGPAPNLDADPSAPGDNLGYAAFGHVVEGMDVVRAILALPTPGVARNPVMAGQILDPPVAIISAKRA
jgi:peptidyl-prolyl cis-trans isomerase A (cyclophilin A)